MSLRSTLSVLAVALSLAVPALAAAQDVKIGYVEYERILAEVADVKAAKSRFQKWVETREKELAQEQENLLKEKDTLEKQASAMTPEARTQKVGEFQKKYMEHMQKLEKSRMEIAERERKEMDPINKKLDGVIRGIAQREGLGMVFEKRESGLLFAQSQYDLTNEIIRTYNNSSGKPKDAPVAKDAPKK